MASLSATPSDFELEAKRKEDSSWHPCQVSLSSVGDGLFVDFGNPDAGVEFLDKEEVTTQLRFRSVPLKGNECSSIKEGQHVLATNKLGKGSLFYDAKVEKVLRVRHYRGPCRCMFTIKWLHQDFEDGITVPSSSIMKLAMKSITDYPTVVVLFESEQHVKPSGASPFFIDDFNCDMDLSKLLEKQIREISNSADASGKEIPTETHVSIKVGVKGSCKAVAAAKISIPCVKVPCDQSPARRTTRSSSKLQVVQEVEDPPVVTSSIDEEHSENKSHLSPLAACAALASRMQITSKSVAIDGTSLFYPFISDKMVAVKDKLSSDILTTPFPTVSEPVEMVKSSTQKSASLKSELAGLSYTSDFTNSSAENGNLEIIFSGTTTFTRRQSKINKALSSAIQNDGGISKDNSQIKKIADPLKLSTSTSGKRFTRSALRREKENPAIESEDQSPCIIEADISDGNLAVTESSVIEICSDNNQMNSPPDDLKLRASTNRKRFTRSAFQQEKEYLASDAKCRSTHVTESNHSKGNDNISKKDSCAVKRKKTVSSSGGKSEEQKEAFVETNQQTSGRDLGNVCTQHQGKKLISSKKQSQRFSLRSFPPRTRSQSKCQPSGNMGTSII